MNQTKPNYDKLLKMFCSTNNETSPTRQFMIRPFKQGKYYIATDAYSLIFIPTKLVNKKYEALDKLDVLQQYLPNNPTGNYITIDIEKLSEQLVPDMVDEMAMQGKDVICKECDGEGTVEWEYKHYIDEFDCPVCDGEGYRERKRKTPTGNKIPKPDKLFRMDGVGFQYNQLSRLVAACRLIGGNPKKISGGTTTANVFMIGEIYILVMPARLDEGSDNEITTIEAYYSAAAR